MPSALNPISFVATCLAGWLNEHQQCAIDCLTEENRSWGYDRIQVSLENLGHDLSPRGIAKILKNHGIDPAPVCVKKTTWKEFISRHTDQISATDFFWSYRRSRDSQSTPGRRDYPRVAQKNSATWNSIGGSHRGRPSVNFIPDVWKAKNFCSVVYRDGGAHLKFAASFGSPVPLNCAISG
jgi:hypothetical protein